MFIIVRDGQFIAVSRIPSHAKGIGVYRGTYSVKEHVFVSLNGMRITFKVK